MILVRMSYTILNQFLIIIIIILQTSHYITSHNEPYMQITFENVPINKLGDFIPNKFIEILKKLLNEEGYFDLERQKTFIERFKLNLLSSLDNCPHEMLCSLVIDDFLYGQNPADVNSFFFFYCIQ